MLHQCNNCGTDVEIDCSACKIAELRTKAKERQRSSASTGSAPAKQGTAVTIDEDDYSISEQLTQNPNDHTILYLVLIACAVFALSILFLNLL